MKKILALLLAAALFLSAAPAAGTSRVAALPASGAPKVTGIRTALLNDVPVDYVPALRETLVDRSDRLAITLVFEDGTTQLAKTGYGPAQPSVSYGEMEFSGTSEKTGDYFITTKLMKTTATAATVRLSYCDYGMMPQFDAQFSAAIAKRYGTLPDDFVPDDAYGALQERCWNAFIDARPSCTVDIPINNMTPQQLIQSRPAQELAFGKATRATLEHNQYQLFRYVPATDGAFGISGLSVGEQDLDSVQAWLVGPDGQCTQTVTYGWDNRAFGVGQNGAAGQASYLIATTNTYSSGSAARVTCDIKADKPVFRLTYKQFKRSLHGQDNALPFYRLVLLNTYPDIKVNGKPLADYQGLQPAANYAVDTFRPGIVDTLVFTANGKELGRVKIRVTTSAVQGFLYYAGFGWRWMKGPGWYDSLFNLYLFAVRQKTEFQVKTKLLK